MYQPFRNIFLVTVTLGSLMAVSAGRAICQLTWGPTPLVNGLFDNRPYAKIAADPDNPDIIWAATGNWPDPTATSVPPADGFYNSLDAGASWSQVNDAVLPAQTNIIDFVISPTDPDIIYVGTNVQGVIKTTDGGSTWTAVNSGISHDGRSFPDSTWGVMAVAVDPTDPDIVYCGVANMNMVDLESGSGNHPGFFKSTNGGASWSKKNQGLPPMNDPIDLFDLTSHTVAIASIVVPPQFPSVVVVGLADIEVNAELFFNKTAGTAGRVYFATNRAEGTWQAASGGLPSISWPSSGSDLARVSLSYIFLREAQGAQFDLFASHQGGGASVELNDYVYKSQSRGVYKTAGGSWVRKSNGLPQITDADNETLPTRAPLLSAR